MNTSIYKFSIMELMSFYEWITQKYLAWQAELGERKSVSAFAKYVDVPQTTMSGWMQPDGTFPRKLEHINKLAARFGPEVYEVLGLELPSSEHPLSSAQPSLQQKFDRALSQANQRLTELADNGQDLSEEQAVHVICEVMGKYGFKFEGTDKSTEND